MNGICLDCRKGGHDDCKMVITLGDVGPIFCSCPCGGETSLGGKIPQQKKEPETKPTPLWEPLS